MANYQNLLNTINGAIKTNGEGAITGQLLQTILDGMVASLGAKYQYAGIATPTTNPGTPDENVFYLAAQAGTYTNFGGLVVNDGEVCALKWNGAWAKDVTGAATAEQVSQLGQKSKEYTDNLKNGVTIPVETTGIDSVENTIVWIKRYGEKTLPSPTRIDVVDNSGDSTAIYVMVNRNGTIRYLQLETATGSNIFSISLTAGDVLMNIYGYVGGVSESGTFTISFYEQDIVSSIQNNKEDLTILNDGFGGLKKELFKDAQVIECQTESNKLLARKPWDGVVIGGGASSLVSEKIYVIPGGFYHISTRGWYNYGIYAIYDSNDNYITGEFDNVGGNTGTTIDKIIQMPQNANYMRVAGVSNIYGIYLSQPKFISTIESANPIATDGATNQLLGRMDDAGNIVATAATYWVSELKEISPNVQYLINARSHYSYGLYAFYDAQQNFISGEWANDGQSYTTISKKVWSPSNAKYLRIAYIVPVPSNVLTEFTPQYKIVAEAFQPFIGKKWAAMGDSLTEVNQRTSLHYHDYVAQVTGINVVNLGQSGTGYAKHNPFYNRINTIPIDSDVVTIFGSFNDLSAELPIGEITDNGTTTLCGCINKTFDDLFTAFPLVNLGVITPTPWSSARPTTAGNTFAEQYVNAIIDICKYRSIPCLDLFHCSNLRPWDATFRQLAYSHDDGNGVHPDETGHKLIAPRFEEFIKSLLLN